MLVILNFDRLRQVYVYFECLWTAFEHSNGFIISQDMGGLSFYDLQITTFFQRDANFVTGKTERCWKFDPFQYRVELLIANILFYYLTL